MDKVLPVLLTFMLLPSIASAQQTKKADDWGPWVYLMGQWEGEGGGQPGQGAGEFAFYFDLDGKILVLQNRADYPATKDRPPFPHEDLMVIYSEPNGGGTRRAIYFDNEGHVIEYAVECSAERGTFTFVSGAVASAPRYRLTYTKGEKDQVSVKFEIAPPGKPDAFSIYVEAVAHRKN